MKEFPKQFDFRKEEDKIYKLWENSGFFNPDKIRSKEKYCNVLPPPNANGELHIGHAGGYAVMDIFGRYERMKGKKVLLLPGKDHAGIQTQVVFEKKMKAEKKMIREDLGREKFYAECYAFSKRSAEYMRNQEKKLGLSADWSREKFALDLDVSKIALETFVKMHKDGMVYRGKRIVNWCPSCGTALSDLEVVHMEKDSKLYYIKYPVKNSTEHIIVATTRPETMLGDTAVAVNPEDNRYFKYIGRHVILPLLNKELPIINDRRIDKDFGTGAVKITPAHDPLDWEIGCDHQLETVQVIDERGEITLEGGKYRGQSVMQARENVLRDLRKQNLLEKEEELKSNVSVCERCHSAIEPLISDQWFIDVSAKKYSLKEVALKAIREDRIKIYPERFKKMFIQWYGNIQDWCISRQIWWGHRFPVWYRGKEIFVGLKKPIGAGWKQDENVFDTWFSSGQWPYSTLGYPVKKDYRNFYPTDMMVMGKDILFFWAARMIMLGLYRTGKVPFKYLYFTGLVRDKDGKKMSKSRGNGIDPLEMIKRYGTDALRLSLVMDVAAGQDMRLFDEKIESFRNFVTKLWNIFRYASQADHKFSLESDFGKKYIISLADRWIISELENTKKIVTDFMEKREISMAQNQLRRFTWDALADWYLEIHKLEKNTKVLAYVLAEILKMWHPFTPFVTEMIWGHYASKSGILMMAKWPKKNTRYIDPDATRNFMALQNLIIKIRNIRSSYRIAPSKIIDAYAKNLKNAEIVERLARIKFITQRPTGKHLSISSHELKVQLNIARLIDIEKELKVLQKEIRNTENLIIKNEALASNKNFLKNARPDVIRAVQERIVEYGQKLKIQQSAEKSLEDLI